MNTIAQRFQSIFRKIFDPTNEVTMIDVCLFMLGSGAAFPLPKSS